MMMMKALDDTYLICLLIEDNLNPHLFIYFSVCLSVCLCDCLLIEDKLNPLTWQWVILQGFVEFG